MIESECFLSKVMTGSPQYFIKEVMLDLFLG